MSGFVSNFYLYLLLKIHFQVFGFILYMLLCVDYTMMNWFPRIIYIYYFYFFCCGRVFEQFQTKLIGLAQEISETV